MTIQKLTPRIIILALSYCFTISGDSYSNELSSFYQDYLFQKKMIDQIKTLRKTDIFKTILYERSPYIDSIKEPLKNIKIYRATPKNRYDPLIKEASRRYGLSPALIKAVIHVESGFKESAVSGKGAMGLMQLMPRTAKELGVTNAFNAKANIMGGARLLRQHIDRFGSFKKALIAYNAGASYVIERKKIPQESRKYISDVIHYYHVYKSRQK